MGRRFCGGRGRTTLNWAKKPKGRQKKKRKITIPVSNLSKVDYC
jgi:hypothetical protein